MSTSISKKSIFPLSLSIPAKYTHKSTFNWVLPDGVYHSSRFSAAAYFVYVHQLSEVDKKSA